jgi:thymidylate synthase
MNKLDKDYQALLQDILDNGTRKGDRTGTGTISVFGRQIRHKMSDGFPLLTTKKMPFKTIVTELLWFLRGDTNIKYLVDNNCHIWDGDAYKNYLYKVIRDKDIVRYLKSYSINTKGVPTIEPYSKDEFIERIKNDDVFARKWGELGPIYGKQWREWTHWDIQLLPLVVDQIQNSINLLKTDPDSRRNRVSAWNVGELSEMVLPPCHTDFQFYTRELNREERVDLYIKKYGDTGMDYEKYKNTIPKRAISLMWNQRSCDFPLGIPFNIASYGLLLEIIAKEVNMIPYELIGNLGDCHIYLNQIEGCEEQIGRKYTHEERTELLKQAMGEERYNKAVDELMPFGGGLSEYYDSYKIPYATREPYKLPRLKFSRSPITGIDMEYQSIAQFQIENYESHPTIKAPLSN